MIIALIISGIFALLVGALLLIGRYMDNADKLKIPHFDIADSTITSENEDEQ